MGKYLYIAHTMDEYELPIAVADSPTQLARMLGVKPDTVISAVSRQKKNCINRKYKKIQLEE